MFFFYSTNQYHGTRDIASGLSLYKEKQMPVTITLCYFNFGLQIRKLQVKVLKNVKQHNTIVTCICSSLYTDNPDDGALMPQNYHTAEAVSIQYDSILQLWMPTIYNLLPLILVSLMQAFSCEAIIKSFNSTNHQNAHTYSSDFSMGKSRGLEDSTKTLKESGMARWGCENSLYSVQSVLTLRHANTSQLQVNLMSCIYLGTLARYDFSRV